MHFNKLIIIPVIILMLFENLYSQTYKGKYIISSSSNLEAININENDKTNTDVTINDNNQFSLEFKPQVGYFVIDNFAIGLSAPFLYSKIKLIESNSGQSTFIYSTSPFIRYYFGNKLYKPFIEASYGFGKKTIKEDEFFTYNKFNYEIDEYPYNIGNYSPYGYGYSLPYYYYSNQEEKITIENKLKFFNITLGIAVFISSNISLDFGIAYKEIILAEGVSDKGFQSSIGFNLLFGSEGK